MALQATSGVWLFPYPPSTAASNIGFTNTTLDSANEAVYAVFQVAQAMTLNKIGFRFGTVTVGAQVDVRVETVTVGTPSGTLWQSSSNALQVVSDASDNTYVTVTLGSGTILDAGSIVAIGVKMSGTSAGNLQVSRIDTTYGTNFPYRAEFLGNVWAKALEVPICGVENVDGIYPTIQGLYSVQATSALAYNTASVTDERGIAFSVPFPVDVVGFWTMLDVDFRCQALLYDADTTTILQRITISSDNRGNTTQGQERLWFPGSARLVVANTYRLTFVPDPGGTIVLPEFIGSSAAVMTSFPGYPRVIATARANSGAWVDDLRVWPLCGIQALAFDDAVSVGGGTTVQAAGVWGF